jgi:tRNA(fMet)-specific endonuclease VapC
MTITIVTAEEQLRGRLNGIRQASQPTRRDRLIEAYELLQGTLRDLNSIPTLDFDQVADTLYTELLHQKIRIGTRDLRIGAIALSTNAIVVTRNQRDFSQIPGLMLEDWTIL